MNLPIYSNLKAKLESKGLDSITSGQIAWFVCSSVCIIPAIFFPIHFVIFLCLFCIFILNTLYIKNLLPLSLSIFTSIWLLDYEYLIFVSVMICCILSIFFLKMGYYRIFWTYIIGICYLVIMFLVFDTIPLR